jgi:spore coat protein CotH
LTYDGETISPIGIRYKGSIGAFFGGLSGQDWGNPSGSKIATKLSMKFKIDWNGNQNTFYDLKTIQLHSMNLDNSQMHDRLGYWLFRNMGVPAPRSIHAKLYINGIYNGLFAFIEQIDEQFCSYNFNSSGNLYKEVWPLKSDGEAQNDNKFMNGLTTNKTIGVTNSLIKQFATEISNTDNNNLQSVLTNHMNIDQSIAYAVVDRKIRNDDGAFHWYCEGNSCQPHNFYWYENPSTQKVHLIPWDLDNAFENIIEDANPVTSIADNWGDTTNNCEGFEYGEWGLEQKSAACDKIVGGLAKFTTRYQELKDSLVNGPLSEAVVNAKIDLWCQQIRNATIEASNTHNDAIDLSSWENEIINLKAQLTYARNN